MLEREVEQVHRARNSEVGVGVEAANEGAALMVQVALHLELVAEQGGRALAQAAAEFAGERFLGDVGDVGRHACHGEAAGRYDSVLLVASAVPIRVGEDGLAPDLMESDVLRRVQRCGGDHGGGADAPGIGRGPLKDLHPAHAAADDAEQALDAEMLDEAGLGADHVADRDRGELGSPGLTARRLARLEGLRPARSHAAAEDVRADNEVAVRVDGTPGAHDALPPPGAARDRVRSRDILIPGQGVADEDGVASAGIEAAVGLISDSELGKALAGLEQKSVREVYGAVLDVGERGNRVHAAGLRPQLARGNGCAALGRLPTP